MHYYEKNIVDIKNEYTNFLSHIISPLIYEGFKSMYDRAVELEKQYIAAMLEDETVRNPGVLKIFQYILKGVPQLNSSLIETEMIRIRDSSKNADIFEKLIRAVFKSYIVLLTYNASGKECVLVRERYHERIEIKDFIHKIYIETAKHIYNTPDLFWHNYSQLEIKKNQKDILQIINNSINDATLKVLPLNDILTEYLKNDYIQENNELKVRNMLANEEKINYFNEDNNIINDEDNGELEESNKLMNDLNKNIENVDELILNNNDNEIEIKTTGHNPEQVKKNTPLIDNSEKEYFDKINSLNNNFYSKRQQQKPQNIQPQNKEINEENIIEEGDNNFDVVKPSIVENKVKEINREEFYKTMFA